MPILEMHLMEGRTEEQKDRAAKAITNALVESLGIKPESVRVLITEHRHDEFYVAGERLKRSGESLDAANEIVMGEQSV